MYADLGCLTYIIPVTICLLYKDVVRLCFVLPALLVTTLASDAAFTTPPWRPGGAIPHILEGPPVERPQRLSMPVELPPTFPYNAVDYVATYRRSSGSRMLPDGHVTVFRHGPIVHSITSYGSSAAVARGVSSSFSNIATGASTSIYADAKGRSQTVSFWKNGASGSPRIVVPSDVREVIAGERCRVWIAKPPERIGVAYSTCITSDGVVLRDSTLSSNGSTMEEARAQRVERRTIALAEVLPPKEILDWSYWIKSGADVIPDSNNRRNYQLTMIGGNVGRDTRPGTKVVRVSGAWKSEDTQTADGERNLSIFGPTIRFGYYGRSQQLGFSLHALARSAPSPRNNLPPLQRARAGRIGEACTWFGVDGGWYSREECRTQDGLPLIFDSFGEFVGRDHWEAVDLTRRQISAAPVPPPWMMRWSYWGWPQLDQGLSP